MRGPRFEQTVYELQPIPLSAMQMISEEPIRLVEERVASCDGGSYRIVWIFPVTGQGLIILISLSSAGGGSLGHPKVFINVDKPGPKACG